MEIRSEIAQIRVHSGATCAQTQITIKLNSAVQDKLCFIGAAIRVKPIIRTIPQLSDRPPKVPYLRNGVVVDSSKLEDA